MSLPSTPARPSRGHSFVRSVAALFVIFLGASCIGSRLVLPRTPSADQLAEFEAAGPVIPEVDEEQLLALYVGEGEYRIATGDLLTVQLPAYAVRRDATSMGDTDQISARVSRDGSIHLPIVGMVPLAGMALLEAEEALVNAYHPQYVQDRPNIVVAIAEHRTVSVAVMGAVSSPGIYELKSDRQSLVGALMAASGISNQGSVEISIRSPGGGSLSEPITLPVKGLTIPFHDYALQGGETVVVEPFVKENFMVIGLVKNVGVHEAPRERPYSMLQALAAAGGVDPVAAPRYATVYRQKTDGEVIGLTFRLDGLDKDNAINVTIKPGDVISVEHTPGTWTRQLLNQILGLRIAFSGNQQIN